MESLQRKKTEIDYFAQLKNSAKYHKQERSFQDDHRALTCRSATPNVETVNKTRPGALASKPF